METSLAECTDRARVCAFHTRLIKLLPSDIRCYRRACGARDKMRFSSSSSSRGKRSIGSCVSTPRSGRADNGVHRRKESANSLVKPRSRISDAAE